MEGGERGRGGGGGSSGRGERAGSLSITSAFTFSIYCTRILILNVKRIREKSKATVSLL